MDQQRPRALFLDRDGTINVDGGYVHKIEDFVWIDGIFDFCRAVQRHGFLIIIITNQSGIARGYYTEQQYQALTKFMVDGFANEGVTISAVYHCPDLSGPNRKPAPGMFLKAARDFNLDMANCISVGDNQRDLDAAAAAGVPRNYLFSGNYGQLLDILTREQNWS